MAIANWRAANQERHNAYMREYRRRRPEYMAWCDMRRRCNNPNDTAFCHYGGRGIEVCDAWQESFEAFLLDMGSKPSPKHTLERKDNNAGYAPENCRWATMQEQQNNRRSNRRVKVAGEEMNLFQALKLFGTHDATFRSRVARGWSVEQAITAPRYGAHQ